MCSIRLVMKHKGLGIGEPVRHLKFDERHRTLIILCTFAGLHTRALHRIFPNGIKLRMFRIWSVFVHLYLNTMFLQGAYYFFFSKKNNIWEFFSSLLVMGASVHGIFRQYYMHKHIDNFDKMYRAWDELYSGNDPDWKQRQIIINQIANKVKNVLTILGAFSTIPLTVFCFLNYFVPTKKFIMPTALPYRHQSPDFEILVTYYTFGVFIHTIAVNSSQMLLLLPIVWELGEMQRLKTKLMEIFKEGEQFGQVVYNRDGFVVVGKTYTLNGVKYVNRKLQIWAAQHKKLTEFHKMSTYLNNFEFGMEMVATLVEACVMSVLMSSDSEYMAPKDKIISIGGFGARVVLFYYTCRLCNNLIDISMSVGNDGYAENWTALPYELKRNLHIVLNRATKPFIYVGAWVWRIDIVTLNQILQTAYTVFNFFFTIVYG